MIRAIRGFSLMAATVIGLASLGSLTGQLHLSGSTSMLLCASSAVLLTVIVLTGPERRR